jgi:predicted ester cyclase
MNKRLSRTCAAMAPGAMLMVASCNSPGAKEAAMLKTQADQAAANKQVVHKFIELFQAGKWDDFDQVIATDCVMHYPGGVDVVGLEVLKAGWQVFYGALKGMKITPLAEISEGDILVDFYALEATYTGDYMGQQVSGAPVKYNQVEMVRIKDGKIVEWWVEMDRLWMAQQLGFELEPK